MKEWYTRQEVADLLGVSKATVYHYAKQKKIIKIEDPHRLFREARYEIAEVDQLREERKRNEPTGLRPSELARTLNVPVQRIYALIHETDLPVEQLPVGDERMIYSIPEETATWIRQQVMATTSTRGTRADFYDPKLDIALYQRFQTPQGQEMRVVRNELQEWGFYLPSGTWIPFSDGVQIFQYEAAYDIHQRNYQVRGYTDFTFPKNEENTFLFLDFVYQVWGIENIRIREYESFIDLSIKSGVMPIELPLSEQITEAFIQQYLELGEVLIGATEWTLVSGYRRTTFDLPNELLRQLQQIAKDENQSMSEYVEQALREKIEPRI